MHPVSVINEHFDNCLRFLHTPLPGGQILWCHHLLQNDSCRGEGTVSVFVEERIKVSDQFVDPGIDIEPLTQPRDQSASHGMAFICLLKLILAQGANPDVCRAGDSIRNRQRIIVCRLAQLLCSMTLMAGIFGKIARRLLSIHTNFDSNCR
jgi:hypothetical protein